MKSGLIIKIVELRAENEKERILKGEKIDLRLK